jgi:hypothetical protein
MSQRSTGGGYGFRAGRGGFDSDRVADAVRERVQEAIRDQMPDAIGERVREVVRNELKGRRQQMA